MSPSGGLRRAKSADGPASRGPEGELKERWREREREGGGGERERGRGGERDEALER